jgi:hypothetical protein
MVLTIIPAELTFFHKSATTSRAWPRPLRGASLIPPALLVGADLSFFHEFRNILSVLIIYYTKACVDQTNLDTFAELSKEFYYSTIGDEYEAYYALRDLFEPETEKRKIIDFLIAEEEEAQKKSSQPMDF